MLNTVVISVNTIREREKLIKELYTSLTAAPNKVFIIQQDRVNRIKIFHKKGSLRILVKTYLVIVLPILLDFSPFDDLEGTVDFQLDKTIEKLTHITSKLNALQGTRVIKKSASGEKLKKELMKLF